MVLASASRNTSLCWLWRYVESLNMVSTQISLMQEIPNGFLGISWCHPYSHDIRLALGVNPIFELLQTQEQVQVLWSWAPEAQENTMLMYSSLLCVRAQWSVPGVGSSELPSWALPIQDLLSSLFQSMLSSTVCFLWNTSSPFTGVQGSDWKSSTPITHLPSAGLSTTFSTFWWNSPTQYYFLRILLLPWEIVLSLNFLSCKKQIPGSTSQGLVFDKYPMHETYTLRRRLTLKNQV